ncbi:MAG: AzlD domain-containing protein [Xanthobacteraceae bacterium]
MTLHDLYPYLILVFVGFLPHEAWRWLGVVLARGVDENSEIIVWVRAVATAVLTGVVAKIVVYSPGALAGVPLSVRLTAVGVGMTAFFLARQSIFVGVGTAIGALVFGHALSGS